MRDFGEGPPAGERPVIGVGIGDVNVDFLGLIIGSDVSDNFPGDEVIAVGGYAAVVVEPFRGEDQSVAVPVDVDGGAQTTQDEQGAVAVALAYSPVHGVENEPGANSS